MRKTLKQQIGSKCRHFNGLINSGCDAGVLYDSVQGETRGVVPCFKESSIAGECEKCEWLTEEEIQKKEDAINRKVEELKTVGPLIKQIKSEYKGLDKKGIKSCLVCDGTLHFTHSAYNGHVWMKCETEDCIAFME